jgi:hypothetical protein
MLFYVIHIYGVIVFVVLYCCGTLQPNPEAKQAESGKMLYCVANDMYCVSTCVCCVSVASSTLRLSRCGYVPGNLTVLDVDVMAVYSWASAAGP